MILSRFFIPEGCVWKTGVVLRRADALAEVTEQYSDRQITIRLRGDGTETLLALIVDEMDQIHGGFRRLGVRQLIPCNCSECRSSKTPEFYDYSSLQRRLNYGKLLVECPRSYEEVPVRELLGVVVQPTSDDDVLRSVLKDYGIDNDLRD